MQRNSINISGYKYIADLYTSDDNNEIIYKDFIMLRSLSFEQDDIFNNEIYIIDKDVYNDKELYNQIIWPVANEVERYSKNIDDFLPLNNIIISNFYDENGNEKKLKCDTIKLYHPVLKSKNIKIIVHLYSVINGIKFHFYCKEYMNNITHSETEFTVDHNVYSEYISIQIPSIIELFKQKTFYNEETFIIELPENSNEYMYSINNKSYVSMVLFTIPHSKNVYNHLYSQNILDEYKFINLQNSFNILLYPFDVIEEQYYMPALDLISNGDMFMSKYNVKISSKLGFNDFGKLIIKSKHIYNEKEFNSSKEAYEYFNNINFNNYSNNSCSYILELASDAEFKQLIYKSEPLNFNSIQDLYFEIPIFNSWEQVPELLVARIIFYDYILGYKITSNFTVITNNYYKYLVSFDADKRKIFSIKFNNMADINFNNNVRCIVINQEPENEKLQMNQNISKIIYKPIFYKVQNLQNIEIRQGVTQNIGINLNNYMSKVETFVLNLDGINFIESGRNDFYVIFKVQANKLKNTSGIYNICNQDDEYISSGNWSLV